MEDARRISELATELGYPSTARQVRQRLRLILRDPAHGAFVAEMADGQLAGWVHVFESRVLESDAMAEIGGLIVGKSFRGRGAGKLLMARAERWARARGLKSVYLRSNIIRKDAHAFYKKLGYRTIKTQFAFRKDS